MDSHQSFILLLAFVVAVYVLMQMSPGPKVVGGTMSQAAALNDQQQGEWTSVFLPSNSMITTQAAPGQVLAYYDPATSQLENPAPVV